MNSRLLFFKKRVLLFNSIVFFAHCAMYDGNALTSSNLKLSFVQYHEIYVVVWRSLSSDIYTHMDTSLVEQAKLAPLRLAIDAFETTDH